MVVVYMWYREVVCGGIYFGIYVSGVFGLPVRVVGCVVGVRTRFVVVCSIALEDAC